MPRPGLGALIWISFLLCADGWTFWQSEAEVRAKAAAARAEEQKEVAKTISAALLGVLLLALALLATLMKSPKQKRMELAKEKQAKDEESMRKIAAQANTEKGVDPTPIKVDTKGIKESKNKARAAMKGNTKGGSHPVLTGAVEKLSALDARKPLAAGAVNHFKTFQDVHGKPVLEQVMEIYKRHQMINPLLHPTEPYCKCWEEKWMPLEESRDPEGEEMVKRLAKCLRGKQAKFEDPTFPADMTSLFSDPGMAQRNENAQQTFRKDQDAFLAGVKGIEWKRPNEWGVPGQKAVVWSGGVDPDDVSQGRLGNCYFLAAMAGCALGEHDVLLKDLCIEDHADVGMYGVKFFVNGKWVTVLIDDRIPCVRHGAIWMPIFSSPKAHSGQREGEKELWPMIFEKAWAKLHLSYEATAGGLTEDAASYLSAGVLKRLPLERGAENDSAWVECMQALNPEDGKTFTFLSCAVRDGEDPSSLGLITGHAYSILKMVLTKCGKRLVQVRNPWGEHEWNGAFSDRSSMWTDSLKLEVGYEDEEDGSFFMQWTDFCMWFGEIEICDPTLLSKLAEDDSCRCDVFASHWVAGKTAGGCPPTSSFQFNPSAKLSVSQDGPVVITLFQPDTRCMHHPDQEESIMNQMASVYITNQTAGSKPQKLLQAPPWNRQKTDKVDLRRGQIYHITAATFAPGQQGAFIISVTGHGLQLEPLAFRTPSPKESEMMQANYDPYPCCSACHNDIEGSYFNTALGPQCQGCAEGSPPPTKIRGPPAGSAPPPCPDPQDESLPVPDPISPDPVQDQGGDSEGGGSSGDVVVDGPSPSPFPSDPSAASTQNPQGLVAMASALQADQVACVFLGAAVLLGGLMQPLAHNVLICYAGIKSFRAIQSPDPEDDKQWLTFWLIFTLFDLVCFVADVFLWVIPFYGCIKCVILIFLGPLNGALMVYPALEPLLLRGDEVARKYEPLIKQHLDKLKEQELFKKMHAQAETLAKKAN